MKGAGVLSGRLNIVRNFRCERASILSGKLDIRELGYCEGG